MKKISISLLAVLLLASCSGSSAGLDRKLYLASLYGRTGEVRQLIAAGADVNAVGESGETPLHPAVDKGHVEVVRVLLSSGANTEIRNKFGDRPIDFLVQYDEAEETKALLIKAGSAPQSAHARRSVSENDDEYRTANR